MAHEAGLKRAHFRQVGLPMLLLLPQLAILLLFFFIPSLRALTQAFLLSDPFGNTVHFAPHFIDCAALDDVVRPCIAPYLEP